MGYLSNSEAGARLGFIKVWIELPEFVDSGIVALGKSLKALALFESGIDGFAGPRLGFYLFFGHDALVGLVD